MIGTSPPRPKWEISLTAAAKVAATPASTALPPRASIRMPASAAKCRPAATTPDLADHFRPVGRRAADSLGAGRVGAKGQGGESKPDEGQANDGAKPFPNEESSCPYEYKNLRPEAEAEVLVSVGPSGSYLLASAPGS